MITPKTRIQGGKSILSLFLSFTLARTVCSCSVLASRNQIFQGKVLLALHIWKNNFYDRRAAIFSLYANT